MVLSALFIAISVVLKLLFEVYIPLGGFPSLRINLNSIPIILSGLFLGPIPGFVIGVLSDLLCYVIKPNGPLFLGFTLSSGLTGLIPGLLWKYLKNKNYPFFKWINLIISVLALAFLFLTKTLTIENYSLYYLGERLNYFVTSIFVLIILLFSLFPLFSIYFMKKTDINNYENLTVIITFEQVINSIVLNTLWLTILYQQAWMVLLPARIIANIFLIPLYTVIIAALINLLSKRISKFQVRGE